ncbi:hypothetical protein V1264_004540 [Littorina saxatilis]|uniref:Transposase Tc1-like domain-containing protein n=1 Tax=Littorina saxatilis TaxID=31220 RepID=A0AAN9B2N4_9CAEN
MKESVLLACLPLAKRPKQSLSQVMNVHKSTISRLVIRLRVTGSTDDTPRSGRPSALTARQERFIVRSYRQNPFQSARAVGRQTVNAQGRVTSPQTISRVLRRSNLRCRRPYRGQILTQRHRLLRRNWTTAHRNWRREWDSVVFSDECQINLHCTDHRVQKRDINCASIVIVFHFYC